METTIHDVKNITIGDMRENIGKTKVRSIYIKDEDGKVLELTLFGEEKDLEIEVKETKKI